MTTYQENSDLAPRYSIADSALNEGAPSGLFEDDLSEDRQDCEEVLITDHRAHFGPAELVEHKLSTLLGGAWLPVSHMRIQPLQGSRSHC